jgi:4-amino-4-deoxy-L-arabinose transferase-like glycosyltransferase
MQRMLETPVRRRPRVIARAPRLTGAHGVVLGATVAAVVVGILFAGVLGKQAQRLAGVDITRLDAFSTVIAPGGTGCQTREVVPADAGGVSLVVGTFGRPGQPLEVTLGSSAGVRRGTVPGGYPDGSRVVAQLSGTGAEQTAGRLCIRNRGDARVALGGAALPPVTARRGETAAFSDRVAVFWLRPGTDSWWSVAPAMAERAGRLKAGWMGTWTAWTALALLFAAGVLAVVALARRSRHVVIACTLVGFLSGASWALMSPVFQVPDETKHVAYANTISDTWQPPSRYELNMSPEAFEAIRAVGFGVIVFDNRMRPPWTAAQDAEVRRTLEQDLVRQGNAEGATSYPPLYYYAVAAFAEADQGGTLLDRVMLMRLLSAVFVGLTALFVALFMREVLPAHPWAWVAGSMVAAVQPMLGYIGGSVNNDSLLFPAAAALIWLVSRALRRGFDLRLALGIGAAFAVGTLAKPSMLALVPFAGLGVLVAVATRRRAEGIPWRALFVVAAVAVVPVIAYAAANGVLWDRAVNPLGGASVSAGASGAPGAPARDWQLRELLSYLWQFYLPKLSFLDDKFGTELPLERIWFQGWIGRFGWLDTSFSDSFYTAALRIWYVGLALAAVGLWRFRAALWRRRAEAAVYVLGAIGALAIIHYAGYGYFVRNGVGFEQARYLIIILPLYAFVVALATLGAGRRLGPVVAGAVVVLAFGNALAGFLITAARYYG